MNEIKGYISIREASYRWGVSERRVNQYCAEGRIPSALELEASAKGSERYDLRRGFIPPISERRRRRAQCPDEKYGDPMTLYIDGYLHDVHESEELMLDVFAYLFTKKPRIRDGGFKAYLYKAARHMALRHKSKRKPLFSLDALTNEPDGRLLTEEVIRTEERNRILHFCMSEMNPDYREVLYLTYFEDMSYAQAAEVTEKR